jgi:hypothetical protein
MLIDVKRVVTCKIEQVQEYEQPTWLTKVLIAICVRYANRPTRAGAVVLLYFVILRDPSSPKKQQRRPIPNTAWIHARQPSARDPALGKLVTMLTKVFF